MRHWAVAHGRDGFALHVQERSRLGSAAAWVIHHTEAPWWGKHKNIPFCWINPWGWTWHVGPEEHTLGDLWWSVGQAVLNFGYRLQRERDLIKLPLTDDQVHQYLPDEWKWFADTLGLERGVTDDGTGPAE